MVLEVCDRASANTENAKEAVRALRREFRLVLSFSVQDVHLNLWKIWRTTCPAIGRSGTFLFIYTYIRAELIRTVMGNYVA